MHEHVGEIFECALRTSPFCSYFSLSDRNTQEKESYITKAYRPPRSHKKSSPYPTVAVQGPITRKLPYMACHSSSLASKIDGHLSAFQYHVFASSKQAQVQDTIKRSLIIIFVHRRRVLGRFLLLSEHPKFLFPCQRSPTPEGIATPFLTDSEQRTANLSLETHHR